MKEKSYTADFVLGYNPIIYSSSKSERANKFAEMIGDFETLEIAVGRLSKDVFQVQVIITRSKGHPCPRLENTVSGFKGDEFRLSNGVKIRLVQFSCPVFDPPPPGKDTYLTIEFFK